MAVWCILIMCIRMDGELVIVCFNLKAFLLPFIRRANEQNKEASRTSLCVIVVMCHHLLLVVVLIFTRGGDHHY